LKLHGSAALFLQLSITAAFHDDIANAARASSTRRDSGRPFDHGGRVCGGAVVKRQCRRQAPLVPDTVAPFTTNSRISATIEFGLAALASEIEQNIPRRITTINERISCIHRRVLIFKVNANCDIYGYVDRSGPVCLSGRDRTGLRFSPNTGCETWRRDLWVGADRRRA
jgi:hypothetical protein